NAEHVALPERAGVTMDALPRGRSVAGVELDLGLPEHVLPMLNEKLRLRPRQHRFAQVPSRSGDVVRTEPRSHGMAGSKVHGGVEVAALLGVGKETKCPRLH